MIAIVHLSDIHLQVGSNIVAARYRQIKGAVQSEAHDITDLLLLVTGDLAFSGKQAEYMVATELVANLERELANVSGPHFVGTVTIPGNHDCDFDLEGQVRPALLPTITDQLDTLTATSDVVEQMLKVQNAFFDFEAGVSSNRLVPGGQLFWTREFNVAFGKLLVRCFNSSWVSRKKEQVGQIAFPTHVVPEISPDAALVLSVFHHPYNWFNPVNGRTFRRLIETSSDIVFTGHEHDGEAYDRVSATSSVTYIEGYALQATGIDTGFNIAKVDPAGQTYQVHPFRWEKDMYVPGSITSAMFTRNQALLEHQFVNNPHFKLVLDDIGSPFSHPVKQHLVLSDIFCYPDLKVTTLSPKGSKLSGETLVMSGDVLKYVAGRSRINIAGAPTSGKTSLAKALYSDLLQKERLVPVILQAADIRGTNDSQIRIAVDRAFECQYSKRSLERFHQLDRDAKVVIVDDWHTLNFNASGKAIIADGLSRMFGHVIVMSDDASTLHQVADAITSGALPTFEYCEIKQFGYRLREELVYKWERLGREFEIDEVELVHRISESEYLLDTLIGKGVVPAHPFFLFSVLQADQLSSHPTNYGSYGHIYHALLTTRMARVNSKNLGQKFTYLSMLAFYMFDKSTDSIAEADLKILHERYERDYVFSIDRSALVKELEAGQVLITRGDAIRFRYKYAYYYFLAQYFHDGINNAKDASLLRQQLMGLADNAHKDENAYCLIFYLYMSKDRSLIEHILQKAQSAFASEGKCDLDKDLDFVNLLYGAPPKIEAPSADTLKNREEYLKRQDEFEEEGIETSDDGVERSHEPDLAFQSMNIMGQVLKNFPGDLRADLKLKLTRESYDLGLRTTRAFLKLFSTNFEEFRRDIFLYLKRVQPYSRKPDAEVQQASDKTVRSLMEMLVFGMIKKISGAVGSDDLKDTYEAVRSAAGEADIPTRMIDLAIRLDHFANIPESDVHETLFSCDGNAGRFDNGRFVANSRCGPVSSRRELYPRLRECDCQTSGKLRTRFQGGLERQGIAYSGGICPHVRRSPNRWSHREY